jgi:hypothetical protein
MVASASTSLSHQTPLSHPASLNHLELHSISFYLNYSPQIPLIYADYFPVQLTV